jgi:ribosome-associated protein
MVSNSTIEVTGDISLDKNELEFNFIRASGPGGQNVNKVASAVQLRFDVLNSPSLPVEVRARLIRLARKRISEDGILIIEARRHRTQEQNREDALARLVELIRRAAEKPKERRRSQVPRAEKLRRLEEKRRRSVVKRTRRLGDERD